MVYDTFNIFYPLFMVFLNQYIAGGAHCKDDVPGFN